MTSNDETLIRLLRSEMITHNMGYTGNLGYFEANVIPQHIGIAIPAPLRKLYSSTGYPRVYIESISDRMDMEGFEIPRDPEEEAAKQEEEAAAAPEPSIQEQMIDDPIGGLKRAQKPKERDENDELEDLLWLWWKANQLETEAPLGHTEALIQGRSYITISKPIPDIDVDWDPEVPIIRVEGPDTLYARVSKRTGQVEYAVRIIKDEPDSADEFITLYTRDYTQRYTITGGNFQVEGPAIKHGLGIVPVVPIINRARVSDTRGSSQINRELRAATDAAGRVMLNLQGAAELMAFPFRVVAGATKEDLGVGEDGKSEIELYLSHLLALEDPDSKVTQLSAADLRNYTDTLQEIAKQAASITGLPPQYLSVQSDNPASAEAIRASESRLIKTAERKIRLFGASWERAMRIALKIMGHTEHEERARHLRILWHDAATPTYAAKADGAVKLKAAGIIPTERARIDVGYSLDERRQMREWDEDEQTQTGKLMDMYASQIEREQNPDPLQQDRSGNAPSSSSSGPKTGFGG